MAGRCAGCAPPCSPPSSSSSSSSEPAGPEAAAPPRAARSRCRSRAAANSCGVWRGARECRWAREGAAALCRPGEGRSGAHLLRQLLLPAAVLLVLAAVCGRHGAPRCRWPQVVPSLGAPWAPALASARCRRLLLPFAYAAYARDVPHMGGSTRSGGRRRQQPPLRRFSSTAGSVQHTPSKLHEPCRQEGRPPCSAPSGHPLHSRSQTESEGALLPLARAGGIHTRYWQRALNRIIIGHKEGLGTDQREQGYIQITVRGEWLS